MVALLGQYPPHRRASACVFDVDQVQMRGERRDFVVPTRSTHIAPHKGCFQTE